MTATRRALLVAAPATALSALGLVAVIGVATIGADFPSGRQPVAAGTACTALSGDAKGLDPAQKGNAKIITGVAVSRGLGPVGAAIGVSVALAESELYNYANDGSSTLTGSADGQQLTGAERAVARESLNYPHDRVGHNLDSIGLFQQRPMTGWGLPAQLIDPATSAGLFYDRLVRVPGWESMPPWQAGQIVQGSPSSDGGIYQQKYQEAVGIVAELGGPATGGPPVGATSSAAGCAPADAAGTAIGLAAGDGGSAQWGGYANGQIPANALCPVPSTPALFLECDASVAFDRMNSAFQAVFGQDIGITDGYRSYDEQVACRAEKGSLCANPGTSNHGWAKAVDIGACCGVNTGAGPAFVWLTANAATFGWVHPPWAQPGGSKPEPWHWEFGSIS